MKFEELKVPLIRSRKLNEKEVWRSQSCLVTQFKIENYEYVPDSIRENLIGEINAADLFRLDDAKTLKLRKEFRRAVSVHGIISDVHKDEKGEIDRICLSRVSLQNPQTGELEKIDNHMWLMCRKFITSFCSFYLGTQINVLGSVKQYTRKSGQLTNGVDRWVVLDCHIPVCKVYDGHMHMYAIRGNELEKSAACRIYGDKRRKKENFEEELKWLFNYRPQLSVKAEGVSYLTSKLITKADNEKIISSYKIKPVGAKRKAGR